MAQAKFKLLLVSLLLLFGCDRPEGKQWNASLPWSVKEYHTQNAYAFADAVYNETDGALTIKVFPGAVLGLKGPETIRALAEGLVDMADVPAVQEAGNLPVLALESLPYLIDDQDELRLLYSLSRPGIERALRDRGLKLLYIVPWPRQNIYLKKKVETLADLKGLKIRTYDRNSSEMMELLGLIPLQMPSSDVVPALASGMVDAVMTSTTTGAAQSYWEFLPYIYRTNHLWLSNIMSVSLESWNELDEATQEKIEVLAHEMEQKFWRVAAADDQKKLKILIKNGMQVVEVNEQLRIEMRSAAIPMWRTYMDRVDQETKAILIEYLRQTGKDKLL
jgi:TRAP-type C4-dicarboxylate transport system substrate-binding protein